ncbi:hypothetical protein NDU88_002365 [Pleurodeles waltl]|uniref:Uncharacterized protein n=1 Tax=Pleurodeles waltl TaxID=8319 RepID=A0AAV7PDT9_PLEWA|nr:hypothetical protein NDU88_002365 [Pleurodeles waltl]
MHGGEETQRGEETRGGEETQRGEETRIGEERRTREETQTGEETWAIEETRTRTEKGTRAESATQKWRRSADNRRSGWKATKDRQPRRRALESDSREHHTGTCLKATEGETVRRSRPRSRKNAASPGTGHELGRVGKFKRALKLGTTGVFFIIYYKTQEKNH